MHKTTYAQSTGVPLYTTVADSPKQVYMYFLLYSFIDFLMQPQIPKGEIKDIGLVSNIAFDSY